MLQPPEKRTRTSGKGVNGSAEMKYISVETGRLLFEEVIEALITLLK